MNNIKERITTIEEKIAELVIEAADLRKELDSTNSDAFEEVYCKFVQARFPAVYEINKDQAKHFWNAAMEQSE